jgi:hypothetical protein
MEKIKIRAWDTIDKKMILHKSQELILIPCFPGCGVDKHYPARYRRHRNYMDESCFDWASAWLIGGRYIPMFYLGFSLHGIEVYESDIIKIDDTNWGYDPEGYDKTHDGYLYIPIPSIDNFIKGDFEVMTIASGEVVGNIYENSKLIGDEK